GGPRAFLCVSIVLFVVLGSVLEGLPAIVLFGPLLFPVSRALGIHDVHYAMVVILAMGIGLFAPPFGLGFYAACAIGRVEPEAAMWRGGAGFAPRAGGAPLRPAVRARLLRRLRHRPCRARGRDVAGVAVSRRRAGGAPDRRAVSVAVD